MNDWLVIREPNEEEEQMLLAKGLNPDEMNVVFFGGQEFVCKTRKQTDAVVSFLNSLLA